MESIRRNLPPNPRDKANIISVLFFTWTIKLFRIGYTKVLDLQDLFRPINKDRSDLLGDRLERNWLKQCATSKKPSLRTAILKTFWGEYAILGIFQFFNDGILRLAIPLFLGQLLTFFRKDSRITLEEAYWYAGGIVLFTAISGLVFNHFTLGAFHGGMRVRVAVCSIIYRKALRLSNTALGDTAPGKVVNLLSNDVNRFDIVSIFIHSMWIAPLMTLIVGYLLWIETGWAGMIGIVIVFIVVPIQSYTGKLSSKFRLQTAMRTDERVRFMDEIISGVQVIKMYAWEKPFSILIALARKTELNVVRKNAYVRALYMTFMLFTTRMALFCTMLSIILLGGQLTVAKIFVVSAYFNIVSFTMSQMFVRGIAEIAEALVALDRLQTFLEYEERADIPAPQGDSKKKTNKEKEIHPDESKELVKDVEKNGNAKSDHLVVLKNATARWKMNSDKTVMEDNKTLGELLPPTLNDVNLSIPKGKLVGIVGHVGAGKSSLLQALLKELPLDHGSIEINGKISYTGQEPWVFAGTVKQNILFGQAHHTFRYDSVIQSCALIKDFEQLPDSDNTIIGERGASLSGGQKARISLARCCYREADIYLLDDPLSAVDAHVGRQLFDECIGPRGRLGQLKATRILVTHQVHFLKDADWIVVMKNGQVEVQGTPKDLQSSGVDLVKLTEEIEQSENEEKMSLKSRSRTMSRSSIRSAKGSVHSLHDDSETEIEEEDIRNSPEKKKETATIGMEGSSKGQVKGSVFLNYFHAGGNICVLTIIALFFVLTQFCASSADYWVSFWTRQEEMRHDLSVRQNLTIEMYSAAQNDTIMDNVESPNILSTELCIYIHAGLVLGIFIIGIIRSIGMYQVCVKASQVLHDGMFNGLISTTMRFFDTNPSGRILNRFSKDMGCVDELLPKALLDAGQILLNMFGVIIVTSIVNPLFLIPVGSLALIFMYIRKIYLKTSKNIKRLEGITRSPVFTHLAATLMGLPTIRAFGAERELIQEFDAHQDIHTSSWYMFITTSTAFGLSLDIMCLIFTFIVTFYFLWSTEAAMGDQVGLAITQSMALTGMLQWGIRQSAEVANQLMSVERVLEYRDLTPEKQPLRPRELNKLWPEQGRLEFRRVQYRYFAEAEPVLKGLSFFIHPKEKIGIVGRTGAGKSSLIGAIFRLALVEGEIIIDGVDTSTITLQQLRSKVSIIPQDPVLFSGTLRRNLDPFEEYPDSDLWRALAEVELKDIANGPMGLQSQVLAGGSNFSVGQRQLVCLARAILRKNKILVLDEATANVDPTTDGLIQETIRSKFEECTVLTIAHRLHTIMDSDRVLVMDAGLASEYDAPYLLMQKMDGIFRGMVNACGAEESQRLTRIAKEKFESLN